MQNQTSPVITSTTPSTDDTSKVSFGSGRYSNAASELYKDLQRLLKMSAKASEKIARQYMSDFGAAMKNTPIEASVIGKYSKAGELTLREMCKAKVTATYAISLARLCAYLDDALKFGILPNKCEYVLKEDLAAYVAECGAE